MNKDLTYESGKENPNRNQQAYWVFGLPRRVTNEIQWIKSSTYEDYKNEYNG